MELRPANYEDKDHDECGNTTMAVIDFGFMNIPLCKECLDQLREDLKKYDETVFCYQCEKFKMSHSGWRYGGSCCKDGDIPDQHVGYLNCKDCLNTCSEGIKKK